jgi:ribosome biogenesis GTPase
VSEDGLRRARVIAVGRNAAWIVAEDEHEPTLASMRKGDRHAAMVVPGDLVDAKRIAADRVVVDSVYPRGFALVRRTGGGRTKTMAANIDTIAIVAALVDPPLHLSMIDQLVAFAVQHDVSAMLLLTKADLAGEAAAERTAAIYRGVEVETLLLQPKEGRGIDALRATLASRSALLVGNSGVGKSSIFRALGGIGVVGDLSRFGRGRQTTTSARLFRMGAGFLVDSPGIGEFVLDPMPATELGYLFVEMREPATRCRFKDCRHLSEPDCGVRRAVEEGRITPSRYASYREIVLNPPQS